MLQSLNSDCTLHSSKRFIRASQKIIHCNQDASKINSNHLGLHIYKNSIAIIKLYFKFYKELNNENWPESGDPRILEFSGYCHMITKIILKRSKAQNPL